MVLLFPLLCSASALVEQTFIALTATSCNELGLQTIEAAVSSLLGVEEDCIEATCASSRHHREVNSVLCDGQSQPHVVFRIRSEDSRITKRLNDQMSSNSFLSDLNNLLVGVGNDFLSAFPPAVKGKILCFWWQ